MATELLHPLVRDYLDRVERATLDLPWNERRELLESVERHLAHRLGPAPTDSEVADALERLGPPDRLASGRCEPLPEPERLGGLEWAAISLLLLGGFLGGVGWLVGVFLLWFSNHWKWYDKVVGMLFWPFGLAASMMWVSGWMIGEGEARAGAVLDLIRTLAIFGVPLMTSAYLIRRARP
ncbi:hypothetical protein OJ998_02545 [Solirubrobacter taibaiensis]|nr:hypothetical protein [Solirubrobacter taibaiensis]